MQLKHLAKERCRYEYCGAEFSVRATYLKLLLKAHDQRQLLILPPQPNLDISESDLISQSGQRRISRAATTMAENSS